MESGVCEKCNGTGIVKDKEGVHVCFDCLESGRLDVHSKDLKDVDVRN